MFDVQLPRCHKAMLQEEGCSEIDRIRQILGLAHAVGDPPVPALVLNAALLCTVC